MQNRKITILDTTLRDGEQSPGIALSPDEKVAIARALDELGVDVIEAGFAVSSPGDFEGVRAVAAAVSRPTVASLSRTRREDLDAAVEALAVARGRTRVHIVLATSPIHMEFKLGLEPEEVVEQARESVGYVAGRVDEVEFACEDGVPYAIDFMNPAPDADLHSVGQVNFDWIVKAVADLAVKKATETAPPPALRWDALLKG